MYERFYFDDKNNCFQVSLSTGMKQDEITIHELMQKNLGKESNKQMRQKKKQLH